MTQETEEQMRKRALLLAEIREKELKRLWEYNELMGKLAGRFGKTVEDIEMLLEQENEDDAIAFIRLKGLLEEYYVRVIQTEIDHET